MENQRCPVCGSHLVMTVRKNYDGGLGCLGLILFGWWGLLLGLLGGGEIEMFCSHCGHRWNPGGNGCGCLAGCISLIVGVIIVAVVIVLFLLALAMLA